MTRWLLLLMLLAACSTDHDHHHGHSHGSAHGQAAALSCTRWVDGYELFLEVDPPIPNEEMHIRAHVTTLDDFKGVRIGGLSVTWSGAAKSRAAMPDKPGVYKLEGTAPDAGSYRVMVGYELGGDTIEFDCGEMNVGGDRDATESTGLSFTKEQQWAVPFDTATSVVRAMTREVELSAIVEPAGTDQLTISAPTAGRFFHNPKLALAEGLHIDKGELVGTIAPTARGDDFSELTGAVDEAALDKSQAQAEVKRVKPLVEDKLLPQKRLTEAKNDLASASARLRTAQRRLSRVTAPGGKGGLRVKSSLDGVVTEMLVANGEPVEPGAPLLRVGGERSRWLRARFVMRPDHELEDATPIAIRTPSGERLDVLGKARLLSEHPIVDPRTQLATWIAQVRLGDDDHAQPTHELRSGTPIVLILSVGKAAKRIAVPRGAVVDINTRPYVFVQTAGESFEKRRVTLGVRDNDFIEIISGVRVGERVVTQGGYDIHLVSVIGTVDSHQH